MDRVLDLYRRAADHPMLEIRGIDVLVRETTYIPVDPFDGGTLPCGDAGVDVVMFIDVLHHTEDPMRLLREGVRAARKAIVIKDHLDKYVDSIGQILLTDGGATMRNLNIFSKNLADGGAELIDEVVSLSASLKLTSDNLARALSPENADKLDSVVDNALAASESLALMSGEAREDIRALLGPKSQERVNAMVDNFSRASANVATVSQTLDERVKEVLTTKTTKKIQNALDNVALAASNIADLTGALNSTRERLDLLLVGVNTIVEENRPNLRESATDLRYTLRSLSQRVDAITNNLEGASRNLSEFSRTIRNNPAVLLTGTSKNSDELTGLRTTAGFAVE